MDAALDGLAVPLRKSCVLLSHEDALHTLCLQLRFAPEEQDLARVAAEHVRFLVGHRATRMLRSQVGWAGHQQAHFAHSEQDKKDKGVAHR